jgi:putative ABC transport system substrate-binding protein
MQLAPVGLLLTFTFLTCCAPRAADAQQPAKVARIGYLSVVGNLQLAFAEAFRHELRALGWIEGQNLVIESRSAEGKPERLPTLAAELVQRQVDVLVTFPLLAAKAAKDATTTIPIVMINAADPVGTGLVASLARPGGNITGLSSMDTDLSGKRLALLKEAVPTLSRVAVLWNATDRAMTLRFEQLHVAAQALGVTLHPLGVHKATDIDGALAAMTQERPDALFMIVDVLTNVHSQRIVDFAAQHQLPTMFETRRPMAAGGLMGYGPSFEAQYRRAAYYVDRILRPTFKDSD